MIRYETFISTAYKSYKGMGNYFSYEERWDHFEVTTARTASREKLCNSKLVHCFFKVRKSVHHHTIQINQPSRCKRPDHDQQHCYHHAPKVKPEAATAVVELLMMDVRTPETCWAVHKRQVIKLRNCCIYFVVLFELLLKTATGWTT